MRFSNTNSTDPRQRVPFKRYMLSGKFVRNCSLRICDVKILFAFAFAGSMNRAWDEVACRGRAVKSTELKLWCFSRVWVRVPVVTLVFLSKTLNHLLLRPSDGEIVGFAESRIRIRIQISNRTRSRQVSCVVLFRKILTNTLNLRLKRALLTKWLHPWTIAISLFLKHGG